MPWLMKAEPDSRVVKGKDVKFSVDDFEKIGVSPWDGVRSHEAKAIMKEKMKLGDKILFYHSNCKVPGVFALGEIAKEGYPDYTAWDESHPYFDAKTDKSKPTWYMVDVKFVERVQYPPTLALIKYLAAQSTLPKEVEYTGKVGLQAIQSMALVNRGRLSVQPVDDAAYDAVVKLGEQGGWESLLPQGKKGKAKAVETVDTVERQPAKPVPTQTKGKRKSTVAQKSAVVEEQAMKEEPQKGQRRSKRNKR